MPPSVKSTNSTNGWSQVLNSLTTPTTATTIIGCVAAIVVGTMHSFDPETSKTLVVLGIGGLTGMAVNLR